MHPWTQQLCTGTPLKTRRSQLAGHLLEVWPAAILSPNVDDRHRVGAEATAVMTACLSTGPGRLPNQKAPAQVLRMLWVGHTS